MRYILLCILFMVCLLGCEKAQEEVEDSVVRLKYTDTLGNDLLAYKNGTPNDNIRIFYRVNDKLTPANEIKETSYAVTVDIMDGSKYILLCLDCSQKQTTTYIEFDGRINDSISALYVTGRDYSRIRTIFYNNLPMWDRSSSFRSDMRMFKILKEDGVLRGKSSIPK